MATRHPTRSGLSRRSILTALPALTVAPVPSDERGHDLIRCACETGLSLDLLDALTLNLDRPSHHMVLAQARTFAENFHVSVKRRSRGSNA